MPAPCPDNSLAPGFPGQSRVFADLYYNRYRDYDPVTGRYIQADPIGLAGGTNPFLYAEANPVNLTDPTGQCPWCFAAVIGAAVGVGTELIFQAGDNLLDGRDIFDPDCYDWGEVAVSGAVGAFGGAWLKGMVRLPPGVMKWNAVSKRIRRAENLVGKEIDLHHWLVPRKMYEKLKNDRLRGLAENIFNRPWNLNPVARDFHQKVLNPAGMVKTILQGAPKPALGTIGAAGVRAGQEVYDYATGKE